MTVPTEIFWTIAIGVVTVAVVVIFLIWFLMPSRKKKEAVYFQGKTENEGEISLKSFDVTDLVVTPQQVNEGEPVTVLVQVINIGDCIGRHDVNVLMDGRVVAVREIELQPGTDGVLSVTLSEKSAGEHIVEVDGLVASFAIPPAKFTLSKLTVMPEKIKEGQSVNVRVHVSNEGGCTDSYLVELKIRGVVEMSQQVRLAPCVSQQVAFVLSKKKAGFYPIEIGDQSSKITVEMSDGFDSV